MPGQQRVESVMIWSILSLVYLSLIIATVFELSFENEVIAIASIISYGLIPYIATKVNNGIHKRSFVTYVNAALGNCLFITWLLYIFVVQLQMMFYVFMSVLLSYTLMDMLLFKHRNFEWVGVISILLWINFLK